MRILHSIAMFLALALALPIFVRAAERIPVSHQIQVKDSLSGRLVSFPADRGYSLETVGSGGDGKSIVHIFDPTGMQIVGDFTIADDQLPLPMKDTLDAVFKADSGAVMKPGCCDVVEPATEPQDPPEPLNPTRGPAIAPGSHIVYADDSVNVYGGSTIASQMPNLSSPLLGNRTDVTRSPSLLIGKYGNDETSSAEMNSAVGEVSDPVPMPVPRPPQSELVPPKKIPPMLKGHAKAPAPAASPRPVHSASIPADVLEGESDEAPAEVATVSSASKSACSMYRKFKSEGVPDAPLRQAMVFLNTAKRTGKVPSSSHMLAIADYSQNSRSKRFYLLDLNNGAVTREKVSHGSGRNGNGVAVGDPSHDGMLKVCGGNSGSNLTRAGFFRVGDYYYTHSGHFGWPMLTRKPPRNGVRLEGLSPSNSHALQDGVVFHEAQYNQEGNVPMGRSYGCPAFVPGHGAPLFSKMVADESLYYSYAPQCQQQMAPALKQAAGWQSFCQ